MTPKEAGLPQSHRASRSNPITSSLDLPLPAARTCFTGPGASTKCCSDVPCVKNNYTPLPTILGFLLQVGHSGLF